MPDVDVVLVRPPYGAGPYDQLTQEPVGLCSVAASMRAAGLSVSIVDAEFEELGADDVVERIEVAEPTLVGVSVMGRGAMPGAMAVSRGVRRWAAPSAHVTFGGMFPSSAYAGVLGLEDGPHSVVCSEGEIPGTALALALRDGREWRGTRGVAWAGSAGAHFEPADAPDLASIPAPSRDLLPLALGSGRACCVSTSRGCAGTCSFCSVHGFYRMGGRSGWCPRSAEAVLDELEALQSRHGIHDVVFVDDDFIGNSVGAARAVHLAEGMRSRALDLWFEIETRPDNIDAETIAALADAGLKSVFLGVEASSEVGRRGLGKSIDQASVERAASVLRDNGVLARMGFIMFRPRSTLAEVMQSARFLADHGQANPHSLTNALHVAPGTPITARLAREGLLGGDVLSGLRWRFADPVAGRLHAIATVAVQPLFPAWYELVQSRSRHLTAMHAGSTDDAVALRGVDEGIRAIEKLSLEVFEEAAALAAGPCANFAREAVLLRAGALSRLAGLVPRPVEVGSC